MAENYWQRSNIRIRGFEEKDMSMHIEKRNEADSIQQLYYDKISLPRTRDEMEKELKKLQEDTTQNDKKIFVIETLDKKYVGEILIWFTDKQNSYFRYGIFINSDFRGNGYAKEALIIVLDYYFNELNYNKCSPTVYSFNELSQQFHERFGFIQEGVLRNEWFARGKYFDIHYYGMLRDEFNRRYEHFKL